MKRNYTSPEFIDYGSVGAVTAITQDSTRVDENEATGTTGLGSYDVCYLADCTPEKGDSPGSL